MFSLFVAPERRSSRSSVKQFFLQHEVGHIRGGELDVFFFLITTAEC